ncbi:MAG: phosphotransferase [Rhodospirillales bacterium]
MRRSSAAAVLMDAPPAHEDVRPFVRIARHLCALGLSAPLILAADEEAGLLLLEDLGDDTFTRLLAAGTAEPDALPDGGGCADPPAPAGRRRRGPRRRAARYDRQRLLDEALLLVDWFLPAVTGRPTDTAAREAFIAAWNAALAEALAQPPTLVLRDFHVDNLMRIAGRTGLAACGLLDFQDAVAGPAAYDLMSLLEDARPTLRARCARRCCAATRRAPRRPIRRICPRLCGAGGAAPRRGDRHLHPPRPRRQARLPRAHSARLAAAAEQLKQPALAEVRRWFDRNIPPHLRRAPEPAPRPAAVATEHPRLSGAAAGAGRGAPGDAGPTASRSADAADHPDDPKTFDTTRRPNTMLDRALDALDAHGVEQIIINAHHLADVLARRIEGRRLPAVRLCVEAERLETGGGVRNARCWEGGRSSFSTAIFSGGTARSRPSMRSPPAGTMRQWTRCCCCIRSKPPSATTAPAIFTGRATAGWCGGKDGETAPFLFAGLQILHPRLLTGSPDGAFSLDNLLYDRAMARGRLYGIEHGGRWCHVGTPADIPVAEAFLRNGTGWAFCAASTPSPPTHRSSMRWRRELRAWLGEAPEALAAVRILLPTRRACRSLALAFVRAAGGQLHCCCRR